MNVSKIFHISFNIESEFSEAQVRSKVREAIERVGLAIYNISMHECTKGALSKDEYEASSRTAGQQNTKSENNANKVQHNEQ